MMGEVPSASRHVRSPGIQQKHRMINIDAKERERLAAMANNMESSSMGTTVHHRLQSTLMKDPSPKKKQVPNMSPPVMIRENTATGDCTSKHKLVDRQQTMLADP